MRLTESLENLTIFRNEPGFRIFDGEVLSSDLKALSTSECQSF